MVKPNYIPRYGLGPSSCRALTQQIFTLCLHKIILQSTTSSRVKDTGLTFVYKRLATQIVSYTHGSLFNYLLSKNFISNTFLYNFHHKDDLTCCCNACMKTRHHLLEVCSLLQLAHLRLTKAIHGVTRPLFSHISII